MTAAIIFIPFGNLITGIIVGIIVVKIFIWKMSIPISESFRKTSVLNYILIKLQGSYFTRKRLLQTLLSGNFRKMAPLILIPPMITTSQSYISKWELTWIIEDFFSLAETKIVLNLQLDKLQRHSMCLIWRN